MKENDNVYNLLSEVNKNNARKYANSLKKYNIHTIGQLYGALNPLLPKINADQVKEKALAANYLKSIEKVSSHEYQVTTLKKIIKAPTAEIDKINKLLNKVKLPVNALKNNKSVLSLGCKNSKYNFRTSFWSQNPIPQERGQGLFLVPNYSNAGSVFNQGQRGTCVANATVTLLDYLTKENYSRQFLYHQCKMLDGSPNTGGTYLKIAAKVLSWEMLKDYGCPVERAWEYNPFEDSTEHQGPPPEKSFHGQRFVGKQVAYVRESNSIKDIITLLSGSNVAKPLPVVIGVTLYSSFNNYSSQRTGWITMPLPGETIIGGHAMLIVGFDQEKKLFLVRNSWGYDWAVENEWGYPGHAIIPYAYIKKYLHAGFSLTQHDTDYFNLAEKDRLYNKKIKLESGQLAASKRVSPTRKKTKKAVKKTSKKKKKGFFERLFHK